MISLVRWGRSISRNADLCLAMAITAGAVYWFSGYFTPVRFDRERIEVQVTRGHIRVQGLYHYANLSRLPTVLTLRVPFPVDRDHPQPDGFTLFNSDEDGHHGVEIIPVVRGGDISFRLMFRPREAKWIRLDYIQPSHVSQGRYLLTTTKRWRHPIDRADYVLRLPRDSVLLSSTYRLAEATSGGEQAFTFSKTDFFPDRDWEFAWDDSLAAAVHSGGRP